MITQIILYDFQKHAKLKIDFDQITTLVGETNRGKSTVLRALRWLCLNQPNGNEILRQDSESVRVLLSCDGKRIKRTKGKLGNHYYLENESYSAFSNGVPPTIQELLNVSELNFSKQHDPSFWLSLTSGEVAKRLNEIISLDVIDRYTARMASMVRKAKAKETFLSERIASYEQKLEEDAWIEEAYQDQQKLISKQQRLVEKESHLKALTKSVVLLTENTKKLKSYKTLQKQGNTFSCLVNKLTKQAKALDLVASLTHQLCELGRTLSQQQRQHSELEAQLANYTSCPLCGKPS